jgi:hypothetical protein
MNQLHPKAKHCVLSIIQSIITTQIFFTHKVFQFQIDISNYQIYFGGI